MTLSTPFITVEVICPLCGHTNLIRVYMKTLGKRIVLCDIDEGPGCNQYFVADIQLEGRVTTYTLQEQTQERYQ